MGTDLKLTFYSTTCTFPSLLCLPPPSFPKLTPEERYRTMNKSRTTWPVSYFDAWGELYCVSRLGCHTRRCAGCAGEAAEHMGPISTNQCGRVNKGADGRTPCACSRAPTPMWVAHPVTATPRPHHPASDRREVAVNGGAHI